MFYFHHFIANMKQWSAQHRTSMCRTFFRNQSYILIILGFNLRPHAPIPFWPEFAVSIWTELNKTTINMSTSIWKKNTSKTTTLNTCHSYDVVWCGKVKGINPYFFDNTVNRKRYATMLNKFLIPKLKKNKKLS